MSTARKDDELEFMTVSNEEDDGLMMPQSYNHVNSTPSNNAFGGWIAEHSKVSISCHCNQKLLDFQLIHCFQSLYSDGVASGDSVVPHGIQIIGIVYLSLWFMVHLKFHLQLCSLHHFPGL